MCAAITHACGQRQRGDGWDGGGGENEGAREAFDERRKHARAVVVGHGLAACWATLCHRGTAEGLPGVGGANAPTWHVRARRGRERMAFRRGRIGIAASGLEPHGQALVRARGARCSHVSGAEETELGAHWFLRVQTCSARTKTVQCFRERWKTHSGRRYIRTTNFCQTAREELCC